MNRLDTPVRSSTPAAVAGARVVPFTAARRERDFGVGYGRSSGYAMERRYTSDWGATRFRCA